MCTSCSPANLHGTSTIPGDLTGFLLARVIPFCVPAAGPRPKAEANSGDMKHMSAPLSGRASTGVPFTFPSTKYCIDAEEKSETLCAIFSVREMVDRE